jgi:hypothetical protein
MNGSTGVVCPFVVMTGTNIGWTEKVVPPDPEDCADAAVAHVAVRPRQQSPILHWGVPSNRIARSSILNRPAPDPAKSILNCRQL